MVDEETVTRDKPLGRRDSDIYLMKKILAIQEGITFEVRVLLVAMIISTFLDIIKHLS